MGRRGAESLLRVVVPDAEVERTLDFGLVRTGSGATRELRRENAGRGGLTLIGATEGEAGLTALEGSTDSTRLFAIDAVAGAELRGGERFCTLFHTVTTAWRGPL